MFIRPRVFVAKSFEEQHMIVSPTYHELIELSNSELAKRMRLAKVQLSEIRQLGESTTTTERIYFLFLNEWEKRLKIGNSFYR